MNKSIGATLAVCIFASGCMRVDSDPTPLLQEVHEEVQSRIDQGIYWDSSICGCMQEISIAELLKEGLSEECITQIVILNNPKLQALYQNLGIAKANFAQASLLKNPIFSFAYRFATKSNISNLIDADLIQNILEIFLIPMKQRIATCEIEESKARLVSEILGVIAEAKIAVHSLQSAQEIWKLKKEYLLACELSLIAAQKLYDAGNIKQVDLAQEESNAQQAKLEVASWKIVVLDIREQLNVFNGIMGQANSVGN